MLTLYNSLRAREGNPMLFTERSRCALNITDLLSGVNETGSSDSECAVNRLEGPPELDTA